MDIARDHVLHSRGGRLGADGVSTVADVERILELAIDKSAVSGLAIHFHGGLVNRKAAGEIATRLAPQYEAAGTYPIVCVWESGLIETIRNNLGDIGRDSVFHELMKKAAEWAVKKLGGGVVTRSAAGGQVDADQLRQDFDDWFAGRTNVPPVSLDAAPTPA